MFRTQPHSFTCSNQGRIYTSHICSTSDQDVYIRFEYGDFLLSVVVHVDSFGRWYVVFSILLKKKSVFK